MNIHTALPGEARFGLQLARIHAMTAKNTRESRPPSASQPLKERKKRQTRYSPHYGHEMRADGTPKRVYVRKNPHPKRPGWKPKSTILTPEKVREIYAAKGSASRIGLAQRVGKQHGVDRRAVQDIWSGRSWSDVTGQIYAPRKARETSLLDLMEAAS